MKCWSCDQPFEGKRAYCEKCRRAIQDEALKHGISFHAAAVRLNATRTTSEAASPLPPDQGVREGNAERVERDYHGE